MKGPRVHDFTKEETFPVSGSVIKTAVREKVGFLKKAVEENRKKIVDSIPSVTDAVSIIILLEDFNASAEVQRIRSLVVSINEANKLIAKLERDSRHIVPEDVYILGSLELENYGL